MGKKKFCRGHGPPKPLCGSAPASALRAFVNKLLGKILFWSLNFIKSLFFVSKLLKFLFSSLDFVKSFLNSIETKITMKKKTFSIV